MIPGLAGVLITLGFAAWFGRLGFLAVSAKSWPGVPGVIVSSSWERQQRRSTRARIRYTYRVGEREFTGSTLWFGDFIEGNAAVVQERVAAWPVGKAITVRHHPRRPEVCCVEPRADLRVWLFFGGALMMAGVILDALSKGD